MNNMHTIRAIELVCDGNCTEVMEIERLHWGDGIDGTDEVEYAISFRADTFYSGQSVLGILKRRIKFAWQSLRYGNYIHNEIVTSREVLVKLRDELTEMLSNPNTAGDIETLYVKNVSVGALEAKK